MNLAELFKMQKELDNRIVKEKGLEGRNLLPEKILALQVELGECANEWRGFKFWSKHQSPRTEYKVSCHACHGRGNFYVGINTDEKEICTYCEGTGLQEDKNPLLEEYVDCLHFILSIGLKISAEDVKPFSFKYENITSQFNNLFGDVSRSYDAIGVWSIADTEDNYLDIFCGFIGLGEMLGFTWEQIEKAYYSKNKINYDRQSNGY